MPGTALSLADRYELVQLIGSGAMGKVWRAHDLTLRREVAIKIINLAVFANDPSVLARFRREAIATAGLSSPNIVGVYDAGREGDSAYLVMELLLGPSLKAMIAERGPLPWAEGLGIAAGVARGLAAAHAVGVTHRDIKPGNVVVVDGVAKIVDFGIARLADTGDETLTQTSTVTGTAAYMSPEQARGSEVGPASDLYSLGCLLMTLFTGATPFHGDHPIALARAQVADEPPRLASRRPDAPAALDALVGRLLSKDAASRPDALATAAELERITEHPGEPAATPTQAMAAVSGEPFTPSPPKSEPTARIPAVAAVDAGSSAASGKNRRRMGVLPWVAVAVAGVSLAGFLVLLNQPEQSFSVPSPTVVRTVTITPTTEAAPERTTQTRQRATTTTAPRRTATATPTRTTATPTPTPTTTEAPLPTPTTTQQATRTPLPTSPATAGSGAIVPSAPAAPQPPSAPGDTAGPVVA